MRTESDRIFEILNNNTDLTALVGNNVFPLIADQGTQPPFVNYHITEESTYSKEGKMEIIVNIMSFAKTYNDVCELSDIVKAALEDDNVADQFYYLGGTPNYNEEKLISIRQNYKCKIRTLVLDTTAPVIGELTTSNITENSVLLTCTATDDFAVKAFEIYKDGNLLTTVTGTTLNYTVNALENDSTYYFNVKAVDTSNNKSVSSNVIEVIPINDGSDTTAPVIGELTTSNITESSVLLTCTATDDFAVKSFEIYKDDNLLTTVTGTTLNYTVNALENDSTYYFNVKAVDTSNNKSVSSNMTTITTVNPAIWTSGLIMDGEFTIQVSGEGTVHWGDGTSSDYNGLDIDLTHTYSNFDGEITVTGESLTKIRNATNESNLYHDIGSLPSGLTYYYNWGNNTSYGNVEDLPSGMTFYNNGGVNTTSGDIADLPSGMTFYSNWGNNTTSGILALPSGIVYYRNEGKNQISDYTSGCIFDSSIRYLRNNPTSGYGLDSTEVDNLLIDLESSGMSSGTVRLDANNAPRTAASDVAVASLESKGVTVTTN